MDVSHLERAYLVEIIFVQLAHKASKIGVFEHARKDGRRKLVDVLDDEAVALRAPADYIGIKFVFQHPRHDGN